MAQHRARRSDAPVPALERRLTDLGARVAAAPQLRPAPAYRSALRQRLVAVAVVRRPDLAPPVRRGGGLLPQLVAGGAAAVVAVAALGAATMRAVPGQPFYGLKTTAESVQLALAGGPADRGRLQLGFARTRLREVAALVHHHDLTDAGPIGAGPVAAVGSSDGRIATTLRTMDAETAAGADDLIAAARSGDRSAAGQLLTFARVQSALLATVAPATPPGALAALSASTVQLRQVEAVAQTLPPAPGPDAPAGPPPVESATSPAAPSSSGPGSAGPTASGPASSAPGSPAPGTPVPPPTSTPPTTPPPSTTAPAPTPTRTSGSPAPSPTRTGPGGGSSGSTPPPPSSEPPSTEPPIRISLPPLPTLSLGPLAALR